MTADLSTTEAGIAKRLREHGLQVYAGLTTPDERCERIRFGILEHHLEAVIVGRSPEGKTETYAAAFERLYGEPLTPNAKPTRKRA